MRWIGIAGLGCLLLWSSAVAEAAPRKVAALPQQPFDRFACEDELGREITFYLSEAPRGGDARPLVVFIQGSGAQPLFPRMDGRIYGGLVVAQAL